MEGLRLIRQGRRSSARYPGCIRTPAPTAAHYGGLSSPSRWRVVRRPPRRPTVACARSEGRSRSRLAGRDAGRSPRRTPGDPCQPCRTFSIAGIKGIRSEQPRRASARAAAPIPPRRGTQTADPSRTWRSDPPAIPAIPRSPTPACRAAQPSSRRQAAEQSGERRRGGRSAGLLSLREAQRRSNPHPGAPLGWRLLRSARNDSQISAGPQFHPIALGQAGLGGSRHLEQPPGARHNPPVAGQPQTVPAERLVAGDHRAADAVFEARDQTGRA